MIKKLFYFFSMYNNLILSICVFKLVCLFFWPMFRRISKTKTKWFLKKLSKNVIANLKPVVIDKCIPNIYKRAMIFFYDNKWLNYAVTK